MMPKSGRCRGFVYQALASALMVGLLPTTAAMAGPGGCLPLPPPSGTVVNVSTVSELQVAVADLQSNTTVLIADGTYQLTNTLNVRGVANVTIRGASGNADAVILSGKGMSNQAFGNVPHVMAVFDATDLTVADLTLRDAYFHGIQIHGEDDADRIRLARTRVLDNGEQQIKVSTAGALGPYADDGVVECSVIGYTDRARSAYTNGVDVLAGSGWIIRDNTFQNIGAPSGQLAGPAVLMWRNSIGTIVERNRFIENDRAIALGLSAPDANSRDGETTYDHQGGVIRNNMIYRFGPGDVGITVNYAKRCIGRPQHGDPQRHLPAGSHRVSNSHRPTPTYDSTSRMLRYGSGTQRPGLCQGMSLMPARHGSWLRLWETSTCFRLPVGQSIKPGPEPPLMTTTVSPGRITGRRGRRRTWRDVRAFL